MNDAVGVVDPPTLRFLEGQRSWRRRPGGRSLRPKVVSCIIGHVAYDR